MLRLHYGNILPERIGPDHGLTWQSLEDLQARVQEAHASIQHQQQIGRLGFGDLPYKTREAQALQTWAKAQRSKFDTLVVLGIGGSALGNIALHEALRHPYWNALPKKERRGWLRLFVLDNVDPDWTRALLETLDLRTTLVNVISKSGTTPECLAHYFIFRQALNRRLGVRQAARHLVFTTDAKKGYLREQAQRENITAFEIPANVEGRFSVLTSVGLVSAALTGLNVLKLLEGARTMARRCESPSLRRNPAALYAVAQYLFYWKGRPISVLMPYSQALYRIADWYRQLWAESLGKREDRNKNIVHVGPTPVKALGVTDQHSQLQLYREGPHDKVITFLSVEKFKARVPIPPVDKGHYLSGHRLEELLHAEEEATCAALTQAQRPHVTLRIPAVTEATIGQILYFFEMATAYAGELFNVNTFDQPGVELGKALTHALMGRSGYEAQRKEIEQLQREDRKSRYVV